MNIDKPWSKLVFPKLPVMRIAWDLFYSILLSRPPLPLHPTPEFLGLGLGRIDPQRILTWEIWGSVPNSSQVN